MQQTQVRYDALSYNPPTQFRGGPFITKRERAKARTEAIFAKRGERHDSH